MSLNTGAEARSLWMLWWYYIHNTCKYNNTCDVSRNIEPRSCNWKRNVSHILGVCLWDCLSKTQYTCSILTTVAFCASNIFLHYLTISTIFKEVYFFVFATNISWKISQSKGYEMHIFVHENYPIIMSDFNEYWIFSTDFRSVLMLKFIIILKVGAKLFHVEKRKDGQTNSR